METEPSVRAQVRRGVGTAARVAPAAAVGAIALTIAGPPLGGLVESYGRSQGLAAALPEHERQEGETTRYALDLGVRDPGLLEALAGEGASEGAAAAWGPTVAIVVVALLAGAFLLTRKKGGKA